MNPSTDDIPNLLTAKQVAQKLGCCLSMAYSVMAQVDQVVIGKRGRRVEASELNRYIESRRRRGPIESEQTRWVSRLDIERVETAGSSRKRATVSELKRRLELSKPLP